MVELRREYPAKGAHVLARMLRDRRYDGVPSKSTITSILRRHGLIDPAESTKHKPFRRFEHERPNELWQMDFKGHIPISGGGRCHPLTILDDHSRFSLGVKACRDERTQTVQAYHYGDAQRLVGGATLTTPSLHWSRLILESEWAIPDLTTPRPSAS